MHFMRSEIWHILQVVSFTWKYTVMENKLFFTGVQHEYSAADTPDKKQSQNHNTD
jgi:hypothetical protein